jgi:c-di-GMP-binding flagellar brake protein YcgR
MAAVTQPTPTIEAGQHVNVRHLQLGVLPARVEAGDGSTVTVALNVRDERVDRMVGQDCAVELTSGRGIYRFSGTLRAHKLGSLTISLNGEVERIQRRDFVRVPAHLDVTVRGIDENIGGTTATIDVSGNGLQVIDRWNLPLGLDVRVELALPDGTLRTLGRVVREGGQENQKGISLVGLGQKDEDRLMRYIRERELQALRASRR